MERKNRGMKSQPGRNYGSLTPQLDTVVIEASLVKAVKLRSNPQRLLRSQKFVVTNETL